MTEAAITRFGRLDFVVPCAGVSAFCPLEGHSDDYFEQVMSINVTAVFRLIREAAPHLRASPAGRIVT
ncbi:SDR family NAD(P)-dependent oxidoreductase, partial [Klebsiella pneumoniae]|uniref:SDR family NAD(P)-dependent oxidoreductase n=1 Tax=Klebsiella pneumoniae TaxID=573 RepID=UPI003A874FCE